MESDPEYHQPLSMTKTVAVCAIVVVCFAVVYPKFFHPLISNIMGSSPKQTPETERDFIPPHLRSANTPDGQPRSRPGPHPGMRGAAETRAQQQSGPGRGMMGVVLPMYAIGIVIYLIYTLVKVFSKSKDKKSPLGKYSNNLKQKYSYKDGKFHYRDDISDTDAYRDYMRRKFLSRENQPDSRTLEDREMAELQKRLVETECQMSRILEAMKNVSQRVDAVASDVGTVAETVEAVASDIDDIAGDRDQINDSENIVTSATEGYVDIGPSFGREKDSFMEVDPSNSPPEKDGVDDLTMQRSETESDNDGSGSGVLGEGAVSARTESGTDSEEDDGDIMEELRACKEKMMKIEERMLQEGVVRRKKKSLETTE